MNCDIIYKIKYRNKDMVKLSMVMIITILFICFLIFSLFIRIESFFSVINNEDVEITAHRGASFKYPENTMIAFYEAKNIGSDYIEFDIHQTKDGKLVVSHDSNLKRVSGVNKNIIDMNYDEINKIDIGSFFNKKYKNERMPLLEDVLKYAKENNIKLNIELKPIGKEKDFEKNVVDLIYKYNLVDRSVVASQSYETIKNVKKYDDNITTVYVTSKKVDDINKYNYADIYSIEQSKVNEDLINDIHNANKKIYVWTVNNKEDIYKFVSMKVDNIITDNVELAVNALDNNKSNNLISAIIKIIKQ